MIEAENGKMDEMQVYFIGKTRRETTNLPTG